MKRDMTLKRKWLAAMLVAAALMFGVGQQAMAQTKQAVVVGESGNVTAVKDGTADAVSTSGKTYVETTSGNTVTITTAAPPVGKVTKVTVKSYAVTSAENPKVRVTALTVTGTGGATVVNKGSTLQMTATVAPTYADLQAVTVRWSITSGSEYASIDASTGELTAGTTEGDVVVTATATDGSGVTGQCTVTVVKPVPAGAIRGKFTISNDGGSTTEQVYFSQGNLQATYYDENYSDETPGTWSWAFATNQWDYIGGADYNNSTTEWTGTKTGNNFINGNGTMSENGTVDLFNWVGASAASNYYILTAPAYYGISNIYSPLSAYGSTANENLMHDWGECIGAGWRTLTMNEWIWILGPLSSPNPGTNCRLGSTVNSTENARFSPATVNTDGTGMKGLILFPDGLTIANIEGVTWGPINNIPYDGTNCTNCTTAGWAALAAKGCVFLPVTSFRFNQEENSVDIPINLGFYWSATGKGENTAYSILFSRSDNSYASTMEYKDRNRTYGCAVRLVIPVSE